MHLPSLSLCFPFKRVSEGCGGFLSGRQVYPTGSDVCRGTRGGVFPGMAADASHVMFDPPTCCGE